MILRRRYVVEQFNIFCDDGGPDKTEDAYADASLSEESNLRTKFMRVAVPTSAETDRIKIVHQMCGSDAGQNTSLSQDRGNLIGNTRIGRSNAQIRRPSVVVGNQFRSRYIRRDDALKLVEEHIQGNVLRMVSFY